MLDRLREPQGRKACHLVSRAFERATAARCRALRVLRRLRAFLVLERLDLSACATLNDTSLAQPSPTQEGPRRAPPNPPPLVSHSSISRSYGSLLSALTYLSPHPSVSLATRSAHCHHHP